MVLKQFHFNGFSTNMLYFFIIFLSALFVYPNIYYRAFLFYIEIFAGRDIVLLNKKIMPKSYDTTL